MLRAAAGGDDAAANEAYDALYSELRSLAHRHLRGAGTPTLQTTELIHEAYVKIASSDRADVVDRGHFLALAARVMRQVLVDHVRGASRLKRGGGVRPGTLDDQAAAPSQRLERVLSVDEALARLAERDGRMTSVVECKYFAGLTDPETALALGVSERTVRRLWVQARSELRRELAG